MAREYEDMGGSSASNPSALRRWLTSLMMRHLSDPRVRRKRRMRFETQRQKSGLPHRIEYFHQVEDPYSHLAAQVLQDLLDTYDVELATHLVSAPPGANAPEPDMLLPYSHRDCSLVAPHYGLRFPTAGAVPRKKQTDIALRMLAGAPDADFPQLAVTVGQALWSGDLLGLKSLADRLGESDPEQAAQRLASGDARREKLGHYSGAMFFYAGEWYWGVDRLYHLENRLLAQGLRRDGGRQLLVPRPGIEMGTLKDKGSMSLEVYTSVRSPYTAIIFDKAVALAHHAGVKLIVRPVLPMVMRGAPVTMVKGKYIFFDAAREAETLGMMWGDGCDPIGKPVRQIYAIYPWAVQQGRGVALLSSFMRMAWSERVNVNRQSGMRRVVEDAGLDWGDARVHIQESGWQQTVEENRLAMYGEGVWGVPAFRLLDAAGKTIVSTWGADRLWLIARYIQEKLKENQPPEEPSA
jgi:2-hydroxychromene-2-carboxylate isomerase